MRSSSLAAVLVILALPATAAPPREDGPSRWVSPRLDGAPVLVENLVTGQAWSAWSYATSGEFDLALSSRDAAGRWSAPVFLGAGDGVDQVDPAFVADANGVVYVAYAERGSGRILVAALASPTASWRPLATVATTAGPAAAPSLRVIGDRLVLAFRAGRAVEIHELPLHPAASTQGIDDGPDPFGNAPSGGGNGNGSRSWKPRG